MEIRPGLTVDDQFVEEFCQRHQIRRLAVFGSVPGIPQLMGM